MLQTFKAELFKALGHPVRIRTLEILRDGELTVSELQSRLEIDASSVSQHLSILRAKQLVIGQRDGTSVRYRIADPQVLQLLDIARAIFEHHLGNLQAMAVEADEGSVATAS